jgi:hypothetical protein
VATSLTSRLDIPRDPRAAFLLLSDPDYVQEVARRTGGRDVHVTITPGDDGGIVIVSARTLPAKVPSYAKPLIGEQIRLTETRTLGPADGDGTREGRLAVDFHGAPAHVTGPLRLAGDDGVSALDVDLQVKASVPLVGGKIERFISDQIAASMRKEAEVAAGYVG